MKNQIRIQFSRDELVFIKFIAEEKHKMYEEWAKNSKRDFWKRESIRCKGIADKADQALICNMEKNMEKTIKRYTAEKELRLATGYTQTKEAYEAAGAKYMGTLTMAAKAGYYTPAGCERLGQPVTQEELVSITHFAIFADCYPDQTIQGEDGHSCRPCLPVFRREAPGEPQAIER